MADRSKSEAIRRVLEANPDIKAPQARIILANEGIEISLDLFRMVKRKWLGDRKELLEAEQKYKEYWSPEAVERRAVENKRRAEEEARRKWEEQVRRRRMEEEELKRRRRNEERDPSLWWEYWAWNANSTDEDEEGPKSPEFPPTMDTYEAFYGPMVAEQGADPPTTIDGVLSPETAPAPERRELIDAEVEALVSKVVSDFTTAEWNAIVGSYQESAEGAKKEIAADLKYHHDLGHTPEEAVAQIVASLRGHNDQSHNDDCPELALEEDEFEGA